MPIDVIDAVSGLTHVAASRKAEHRLPYADCFAAALAHPRKALFVTGDKDFGGVESVLKIVWL